MPIENRTPDVTVIKGPSADSLERIADGVEEIASRLPAADS
jgi:hypothetical protein